ncbi:MAG TPA: hypothetical protein VIK01_28940 [Polyangiaceae bacterium]
MDTLANGQLHWAPLGFGRSPTPDRGQLIPENAAHTHCVAVFARPQDAQSALRELQAAGVDTKRLSVVGSGHHADDHAVGLYADGDDVKSWGKEGAFWGGVFGILFWPAFFFIPGIGPVLTAGLIGSALINTVEAAIVGAALGGGTGALAAALRSWGIPKDAAAGYEADLKAMRVLVVASGTDTELAGVRDVLAVRAMQLNVHHR